jgi:L-ascorbate metabolism protein UlaG (beta-lactamase superfamily)
MEIKWHGNTCFTLKDKGLKLLLNPDKQAGSVRGNVVLTSLEEGAEVKDADTVVDWPGEYEIQGVSISAYQAWTKSKSKEEEEGAAGDETIIYYFDMGGIKVCHLGDVGHVLTSDMVKAIGDVDLLMIDLGEKSNLDGKKPMEIIEAIEPRVVMPMGEGDLEARLKELGLETPSVEESYIIKSRSELPDDKRLTMLLKKV